MVPQKPFDKILMAIRELSAQNEGAPLRGWVAVADVVYKLKSTLKGIVVWDVIAAGLGARGTPRDLAYLEVKVRADGNDYTTVFTKEHYHRDKTVEDLPWAKDQ